MPAPRPVTELQERKRLLVLQADLHRALVQAECANVRGRLEWLRPARDKARTASPWIAVGAAAIGVLAARRFGQVTRWIPAALAAWRWLQQNWPK